MSYTVQTHFGTGTPWGVPPYIEDHAHDRSYWVETSDPIEKDDDDIIPDETPPLPPDEPVKTDPIPEDAP